MRFAPGCSSLGFTQTHTRRANTYMLISSCFHRTCDVIAHRQYFGRDEDGSGWVAVEPAGKPSVSGRDAQGGIGRRRHDSDSDASPPRRQRHDSGSDASPPRRQRHDSGSDASPPRRQRHDSGSDASPPRRQRHDSGSDASPPRRQRHDSGSDASPPRRQRHDWGSDASPPRKPVAAGGAGPRPASPRMADGTRAGMILAKDLQVTCCLRPPLMLTVCNLVLNRSRSSIRPVFVIAGGDARATGGGAEAHGDLRPPGAGAWR